MNNNKINLELVAKTNPAEIFQSLDIKFAHCIKIDDNTYKQLHEGIKCRDFLGDCIYSKVTAKPIEIYGFKFNNNLTPLAEDKLRLSLKFPNSISARFFKKNFKSLVEKDVQAGLEPSKWYRTNKTNTILLEADATWMSTIWKISLYTFYIKLFSYENLDSLDSPEDDYAKILTKEIEDKLLGKIKEPKEYLLDGVYEVHNNSGFYTIITGKCNKKMTQLLLGAN